MRWGAAPLRAALAAVLLLVVAGCDLAAGLIPTPEGPQACGQVFNPVRCLAITDSAAFQLKTTREDVVSLQIVPEPTPRTVDGQVMLDTTSGGRPIDLIVVLTDGTSRTVTIQCAGIPSDPGCFDDPRLSASSITHGGYFDTPEGASPVPTAAPDALAHATELRIDHLDIPIDHVGRYDVTLGEVRLPNGLLTTADFVLVDDWPPDLTILQGGVGLEIRSLDDGKPIWNIYEHGWREGTERVAAVLVFEVFRFDPGATLSIRDVVVR